MDTRTYTVGAFAKLTGVTERTLRFYHKKGLLEPSGYNELGHRLYTDRDLIRLQQILTLKFLDYPLERIAQELEADEGELRRSLERQAKLLREKKEQLDRMLYTLDYTLELADGDKGGLEPSVLLLLIRSIATEKEQRRWIEEKMPPSLTKRLWPDGDLTGSWRAVEQEAIGWVSRLKKLMREGKPPDGPEAQRFTAELSKRLEGLLSRMGQPLSKEEIQGLEAFGKLEPPYSFGVPILFTAEEERYIERMWDAAIEIEEKKTAKTNKNGGDSYSNKRKGP
ncbi:hypothetical protein CDO73_08625 [Saccharibacillus sp. O23]|uniref:MerR family transcriptional regulator n=1 Tax=Saccharibacillus sp. O23 TaxID=2009338 RepID=UPI000B4E051C|nr:MerR family transcriptional regulator [Saccharibacillus sp. O23]OWR31189.1 hypothetical protein CDO73_08625 [Saccharibacillus sp. O23]